MAKAKRGQGEGSISKRSDGRWEARLTLPDGRRKSFYGPTRADVMRKLTQAQHDLTSGLPVVAERETVEQYLLRWVEMIQPQVKPSTWKRYRNYVRYQIIPALGKTVLSRLTAQQVQLFYARQADISASTTVQQVHLILHRALKDAQRMGLVQRNVTEMVRTPRREPREMTILSEEQAKAFLDGCVGDSWEALYLLALTTAMREGELLGLRWSDVDLEQHRLQVRVSLQASGNPEQPFMLAAPKTAYSKRTIKLSHTATEALRHHRLRQITHAERLGESWQENDLIFPNQIGELLNPSVAIHSFQRKLKALGLPRMRFHDLRHTAITLLLARGINPKMVQEMAGHSDIAITLGVYGHVIPDMQQAVADLMDAIFEQFRLRLASRLWSMQEEEAPQTLPELEGPGE